MYWFQFESNRTSHDREWSRRRVCIFVTVSWSSAHKRNPASTCFLSRSPYVKLYSNKNILLLCGSRSGAHSLVRKLWISLFGRAHSRSCCDAVWFSVSAADAAPQTQPHKTDDGHMIKWWMRSEVCSQRNSCFRFGLALAIDDDPNRVMLVIIGLLPANSWMDLDEI